MSGSFSLLRNLHFGLTRYQLEILLYRILDSKWLTSWSLLNCPLWGQFWFLPLCQIRSSGLQERLFFKFRSIKHFWVRISYPGHLHLHPLGSYPLDVLQNFNSFRVLAWKWLTLLLKFKEPFSLLAFFGVKVDLLSWLITSGFSWLTLAQIPLSVYLCS